MSTILKQESSPDPPLNPMTNEEKFKTAQERTKEFKRFCRSHKHCTDCLVRNNFLARRFVSTDDFDCKFLWLELEAKEKKGEFRYE